MKSLHKKMTEGQATALCINVSRRLWWLFGLSHVLCVCVSVIIIIIIIKRWCLGWHYHAQNVAGPPNKH